MQGNTLAYSAGKRSHLFSLMVQDNALAIVLENTLAYYTRKHISL
jgi:hypothetical protein